MQRDAVHAEKEAALALEIAEIRAALGAMTKRIDSIESWQKSAQKTVKKWPLVVLPLIVVMLNVAPKKTLEVLEKLTKLLF